MPRIFMNGVITRLTPNQGYGFIRGDDHVSRFFHANDVQPDRFAFDHLREGVAVKFEPVESQSGPRAIQVEAAR